MPQFGTQGPPRVASTDPSAHSQLSFTLTLLHLLFWSQPIHYAVLLACTSCPFLLSLPFEICPRAFMQRLLLGEDIHGSSYKNSCILPWYASKFSSPFQFHYRYYGHWSQPNQFDWSSAPQFPSYLACVIIWSLSLSFLIWKRGMETPILRVSVRTRYYKILQLLAHREGSGKGNSNAWVSPPSHSLLFFPPEIW